MYIYVYTYIHIYIYTYIHIHIYTARHRPSSRIFQIENIGWSFSNKPFCKLVADLPYKSIFLFLFGCLFVCLVFVFCFFLLLFFVFLSLLFVLFYSIWLVGWLVGFCFVLSFVFFARALPSPWQDGLVYYIAHYIGSTYQLTQPSYIIRSGVSAVVFTHSRI